MGLSLSIEQSSYEKVSTDISQISNEECINYVSNNAQIITNIDDSTIGNLEITEAAFLNSPSCILKASLDSSLINTLSNKQSAQITDIAGLFTALDALTRIGGSDDINQSNYQFISNEVTQQMNSLCANYSTTQGAIINNIEGSKVRNVIITSNAQSDKSSCIIDNMTKSYISNNESNDQTAKITRMGIMALILILLLVGALIFIMKHHKKHKDADAKDSESISFGNDDTGELAEALFNNNIVPSAPRAQNPPPPYKAIQ